MQCAFRLEGSNITCPFNHTEHEWMEVDGKNWCPVHAPLEDENGNPTKKGNWNDVEIKRFYAEIHGACPWIQKRFPIAPIKAAIPISPNIISANI